MFKILNTVSWPVAFWRFNLKTTVWAGVLVDWLGFFCFVLLFFSLSYRDRANEIALMDKVKTRKSNNLNFPTTAIVVLSTIEYSPHNYRFKQII